jgi:hypothetical protein
LQSDPSDTPGDLHAFFPVGLALLIEPFAVEP